jgi:uncharacterized RDD family membrane protein YckC
MDPRYAGFWIRLLAYFVDLIILVPINLVIGYLIFPHHELFVPSQHPSAAPNNLQAAQYVNFLVTMLYTVLFNASKYQTTPGGMAVGIRVTDLEGRRISFGKSIVRYFASILSALILFMGFVAIAFTKRKQGLHDIIAGTLVVRK